MSICMKAAAIYPDRFHPEFSSINECFENSLPCNFN